MLTESDAVLSRAKLVYSQAEVEAAIDRLAAEITHELQAANPIVLGVMIGAVIPLGLLLPRLTFSLQVDYVHASRYNGGTIGGELSWKAKPHLPLQGRNILLFDDILDDGVTLQAIKAYCAAEGAAKIWTCVLVEKVKQRPADGLSTVDFSGLMIEDEYVFGYGMDYKEYYRNVPAIYAVSE